MGIPFASLMFAAVAAAASPENLFDNPEFDDPKAVWKVIGKGRTVRCETAPMSGEWIYRTTGNSYNFLCGKPRDYEPETEYTMEVRARGIGGPATLSILELYRKPDGKIREGVYAAEKVRLGDSFRIYRFPFVSSKQPLHFFSFYKIDPKDDAGGIEIASVRLFKGRLSTLEFRPLDRSGRKAPVPGTEVPLPSNPYGRRSERLLALALAPRDRDVRELQEAFNGLNAEVDVVVTTGQDQDIYETDSPSGTVERRLKEKKYNLFVIPARAAARTGANLFAAITNTVHSGAGLYMLNFRDQGRFAPFLESVKCAPAADGSLARAFPGGIGGRADFDPSCLAEGRFGRGRVIVERKPRGGILKIRLTMADCGTSVFPFGKFFDPYLARLFYRAAGMDAYDASKVEKVAWRVFDSCGVVRARGESRNLQLAKADSVRAPDTSSRHIAAYWLLDASGNVLDYDAQLFDKEGPRISQLLAVKNSVDGDSPAVFRASVEQAQDRECKLRWVLMDFSGRVLEIGKARAGEDFEVPLRRLYTNMGMLRVQLREGKKVRDTRAAAVYARSRDIARTESDFTPSIWGALYSLSRDTFNQFDRHLEDVGFRASVLPVPQGGYAQTLRNGMALGGNDLGEETMFRPFGQRGNVRMGGINTEKGRAKMLRYATAKAKGSAPFGVTQYMVTDEPNFTLRHTADELDEDPENIAEYRSRMQEKYSTIEEFNARHRSGYSSFSELGPGRLAEARRTGKFAEYIEWRNFNVDRWCEALKEISDAAKAEDPMARVSLANSFGQTSFSANDYWKLLTKAGLGFSNEYTAMVYFRRDPIYNFDEFYRSFRPDMRLWGYVGYGMSACQVKFMPWWFAAHRYGGFTWFSACGKDFRIFAQPSLAYTQDAADLKQALESSRLMDGLGKLFLDAQWAKRDVAVYYSHDSLHVATLLGKETASFEIRDSGPLHDYMHSRQGAQYLLEDLLHQFDFVSPEQVVSGALKNYKVLVMPRIKAMSKAEVEAVSAFASAGGRIIADELPGSFDELGVKRAKMPFSSAQMRVTGANFDDLRREQRVSMRNFLSEAGVAPVAGCASVEDLYGREAMRFCCGAGDVFVFLRMPGRSTGKTRDSFVLPVKGVVYDCVSGECLGNVRSVAPEMDEGGAAVYSVLASRPKRLRIAGVPDEVGRGESISPELSLEMQGTAPDTVFNVRFIAPSGACRFHMRRNVRATGGKARTEFPMAYNDEIGEWRIVARDAMTGLENERRFRLK